MENVKICFFWFLPLLLSTISILLQVRSASLETNPDWSAISAVATAISAAFVAASFFAIQGQLRTSQEQLRQANLAAKTSVLLSLFTNLEDERHQREVLFRIEERLDAIDNPEKWSSEELEAANTVAARFNSAAVLVINELVDADLFHSEWGDKVIKLHSILKPYVKRERQQRGEKLWHKFDELASAAAKQAALPI